MTRSQVRGGGSARRRGGERSRRCAGFGQVEQQTLLLSRAGGAPGGFPNAPSTQAAISHDKRTAVFAAYTSFADEHRGGHEAGRLECVPRAASEPVRRQRDAMGRRARRSSASAAPRRRSANGSSRLPSLDGSSRSAPTCLAFISDASNLVKGDTNGQPDAFIRIAKTGRSACCRSTARASRPTDRRRRSSSTAAAACGVRREGHEPRSDEEVDGVVDRRRHESARGRHAAGVRPLPRPAHPLRPAGQGPHVPRVGIDSRQASSTGAASVAISRNGKVVGFSSAAPNLTPAGSGGHAQVYTRSISRSLGPRVHGRSVQRFALHRPGLAPPGRRAGQRELGGPDDRRGRHAGRVRDARDGPRCGKHPRRDADRAHGSQGAGAAGVGLVAQAGRCAGLDRQPAPAITDGGASVFYDSEDNALKSPDDHTAGRAIVLGRNYTVSKDSRNEYIPGPNARAVVSPHENYVLFESPNPFLDRAARRRRLREPAHELPRARGVLGQPGQHPGLPALSRAAVGQAGSRGREDYSPRP